MDEIERKLLEIESRNKRSNIIYVLVGISILAIVGSLIIFSNAKRISLKKDQEFIKMQIEFSRNQGQLSDSLRVVIAQYDSLQHDTEDKIHDLQSQLLRIKSSTNNSGVKHSIVSIQKQVNEIDTKLHETEYNRLAKISKFKTTAVKKIYTIRLYSYNPDPKRKEQLIEILEKENYAVKVYPEWSRKPSFFASSATILYYSDNTRNIAKRLAIQLAEKWNFKFKISKGAGLAVNEKERQNTFIIHYQRDK